MTVRVSTTLTYSPSSLAPTQGALRAGVTAPYQTQAVAPEVQARNVQTVMDVASEFSGLVQDMNRQEMTPAQLARLDAVFANFEKILGDVRSIRAELLAARMKV